MINAINTASGGVGADGRIRNHRQRHHAHRHGRRRGHAGGRADEFFAAAADLGINIAPTGNVITGADVNPVTADGIFTHLAALRDALYANDTTGITNAATGITTISRASSPCAAINGAHVQDIVSRQGQMEDQNVATQSLLARTDRHGLHGDDREISDAPDSAPGDPADQCANDEPVAAGFSGLTWNGFCY